MYVKIGATPFNGLTPDEKAKTEEDMLTSFSIVPIGVGEELKEWIAELVPIIEKSGLSAPRIRAAWRNAGIESYELGRFDRSLSQSVVHRNGKTADLNEPDVDPFWDLFFAGLRA